MSSRLTTRSPDAGFTIIEALAVMVVGSISLAAFSSFYLAEQRVLRQQQLQIEASDSLRTALEEMVRDLRVAGRNPTSAANIGFTYADSSEVRFTLDSDGDGVVTSTDPNESKGFRRNGSTIETYIAGVTGWQTLSDFVTTSGTIFRYYKSDGTEITALPASSSDLSLIRRVDVTVQVTRNVPAGPPLVRTESASVRLRNLS